MYLHVSQKLWLATQKFVQSNGHLGWILSVDWPLFWALVTIYNFSTHNNPWDGKHSGKFRWWYFLGTCRYVKMKWSACHKQGTKKKSGSLTGFEPMTSQTRLEVVDSPQLWNKATECLAAVLSNTKITLSNKINVDWQNSNSFKQCSPILN